MTSGWTGGQYALLRALLALACVRHLWVAGAGGGAWVLGAALAAALAAGARDRWAAAGLAALALYSGGPVWWARPLAALLLLHAALPRAPYGSWDARGRPDPGGGWAIPAWTSALAWVGVAALHAYVALEAPVPQVARLLGFAVAPLALWRRTRPLAWGVATGLALVGPLGVFPWPLVVLHAYAFDPAWIPAATRITPATVFYDGTCGLCHRVVRFVLAEDRSGVLRLAPLQSRSFERAVDPAERAGLPDSIVVRAADGRLLVRSSGAIAIAAALGGLWRVLAALASGLPRALADRAYDAVARVRGRLFARPQTACPLVPPPLRSRFVEDDADDATQAGASARR